ncbi:hypothetical protein Vi05172_g2848 [Venturia inaequalis]|nr:hypothetical protein Vi05172_g2848 [Venturia inaequalis]
MGKENASATTSFLIRMANKHHRNWETEVTPATIKDYVDGSTGSQILTAAHFLAPNEYDRYTLGLKAIGKGKR